MTLTLSTVAQCAHYSCRMSPSPSRLTASAVASARCEEVDQAPPPRRRTPRRQARACTRRPRIWREQRPPAAGQLCGRRGGVELLVEPIPLLYHRWAALRCSRGSGSAWCGEGVEEARRWCCVAWSRLQYEAERRGGCGRDARGDGPNTRRHNPHAFADPHSNGTHTICHAHSDSANTRRHGPNTIAHAHSNSTHAICHARRDPIKYAKAHRTSGRGGRRPRRLRRPWLLRAT